MARHHKDMPSVKYPEVSVHITWTESDGPITLRAYPIYTASGIKTDYARERKRVAHSRAEVVSKQESLYTAVHHDIELYERQSIVRSTVTTSDTDSPMVRAFNALSTSSDPVSSEWGTSYAAMNVKYFRRNIMPILIATESTEWTNESSDNVQKIIIEKVLSSRRSSGHEATALETARKHLAAADQIYQRMRDYEPLLPELKLRPNYTGHRGKNEKIKSIPLVVRRKFVTLLENFINDDPRLAIAAIAMYDCGLRTAEAAAVWLDVIVTTDSVTCIFVRYQVKEGVRSPILKTKSSYRLVPTSTWGSEMLTKCFDKLYAVPEDETNWTCDTRLLSSTLKTFLLKAGLSEDYFADADLAMRNRPDYDQTGRPIFDVSAYILRRDWSSRARNICGFTSLEIDFVLGHEVYIPKRKREDLRQLENQTRLAKKLERYVHDARYSSHPGVTPYAVGHSSDLDIIAYDLIRVRNTSSECVNIKIDIEAAVNGETITIIVPEDSQTDSTVRYIRAHCTRNTEPVIGSSYIKEDGTFEDL